MMSKIIYTECDEAPMLATYSLLPVIQRFAKPMGIEVTIALSLTSNALSLMYSSFADREARYFSVWKAYCSLP